MSAMSPCLLKRFIVGKFKGIGLINVRFLTFINLVSRLFNLIERLALYFCHADLQLALQFIINQKINFIKNEKNPYFK